MSKQKNFEEKKHLWERWNEKDLKRTFTLASLGVLVIFVLTIWILWKDYEAKTIIAHSDFLITGIVTIYFGFFTISAYWVSRKVEEYVRTPIRNYEDFIEQAKYVLEKGRGDYRIMVFYPYFSLDDKVSKRAGEDVDLLLLHKSTETNKPRILVLNQVQQAKFLESWKTDLGVMPETLEEAKARYNKLKVLIGSDKFKEFPDAAFRLPIQLFWSSTIMTFIAISKPEKYPNRELKCSGFTSQDPDIKEAFRILFDNYFAYQEQDTSEVKGMVDSIIAGHKSVSEDKASDEDTDTHNRNVKSGRTSQRQ